MKSVSIFAAAILAGALAITLGVDKVTSENAESLPLKLEGKIPLGDVRGRIDHLAVDLKRQRLFVAELGNDTVGIVDLANGKVIHRITGLKEPQGVGYDTPTDTLYVANAGDGSVQLFEGQDYAAKDKIQLGSDADNIRIDAAAHLIFIGYGSGALAIIDPATHVKVGDLRLPAHPESFQINPETTQIFVNVPEAHAIAVVDRASQKLVAQWPLRGRSANFPMALDVARKQVLVMFRAPPELGVFSMTDGEPISRTETCGDADDLFVDTKRGLVYVSCGAGYVDVLNVDASSYRPIAHIPTVSGARTSLFVPELDRLLVAARASFSEPAAIWVFRPVP
jgi:YVTN family beta-propeller protein